MYDETMSDEVAFTNTQQENTFVFDDVQEEPLQDETGTDSASTENKENTVFEADEAEEKRVPYSRFKSKVDELEQRDSMIQSLEERLSELEASRVESTPIEDIDVPREWVELYGDSDVSKRAYKIQVQREQVIQENAVQRALQQFKEEAYQQEIQVSQNEEIIEDSLIDLQESIGRKLSARQEEEILSIVDEFSPTGNDGKYLSLFPFEKAYEIYELRNSKANARKVQARNQVADLTGNSSEGETDSSEANFKRGWDNWRNEL